MKIARDPRPEVLRLEELVRDVKSGDIKLPKFQRPYVWQRADIIKLWDSIYQGYPIGSILLWLSSAKLASVKQIGDLEINERPEEYPTNYLLDGQQRLATICGALFWQGADPKSKWNLVFDLNEEKFLFGDKVSGVEYFPLNKLLESLDFINQLKTFDSHPQKEKFSANADALFRAVKNYQIASVRIGDVGMDQVAPIFERINSTGRKLTIVDLMRAATWTDGQFDLNDAISATRQAIEAKAFEGVPEEHIIRNISAATSMGINREDINRLRDKPPEELRTAAAQSVTAYQLSVDFLTAELPISSYAYLPYGLQLTLLVEFFRICPEPDIHRRKILREWLWYSSFSRYFGTSNTGQNANDLKHMRDFATGVKENLDIQKSIDFAAFAKEEFRLSKATSKSFALLLASKAPRSLLTGAPLDTFQVLATTNRHEYHHIFPRAFLKSSGINNYDAHANICMLSQGNNRRISDTRPSIYFKTLHETLGNRLPEILETNLITMEAFDAALREDYSHFLSIRSDTIKEQMRKLCGIENVSQVFAPAQSLDETPDLDFADIDMEIIE